MYKRTQSSKAYHTRTASHSTKGSASKGASLDAYQFEEQVRSDRHLSLFDKKKLRAELIVLMTKINTGIANQRLAHRISALNADIKRENQIVADNYSVGMFYDAMQEVLPPELVKLVSERVKAKRMENESK